MVIQLWLMILIRFVFIDIDASEIDECYYLESKEALKNLIEGEYVRLEKDISEHGYGKTYFPPGCSNYKRVKVYLEKGDMYFCTKEEAEEAGFEKAGSYR